VSRGRTPKPDHLAETGAVADADSVGRGARLAYFGDALVETPVYDGAALGPGAEIAGPALVEEPFTVVVVPPDAAARVDDLGNYEVRLS